MASMMHKRLEAKTPERRFLRSLTDEFQYAPKVAEAILQENAPVDAAGVLAILGDQADEQYPIHRTATPPDRLATLCTALFDLDARRLRIYTAHPTQDPSQFVEFNP